MTITIWPIMWPIFATIGIWITALLWPLEPSSGGKFGNIGAAFDAMLHCVLAIIATLLTWCVYFAVT